MDFSKVLLQTIFAKFNQFNTHINNLNQIITEMQQKLTGKTILGKRNSDENRNFETEVVEIKKKQKKKKTEGDFVTNPLNCSKLIKLSYLEKIINQNELRHKIRIYFKFMGSIETIRNTSSGYWYITNSLTTLMNEIIQDYKDEQAEYNSILEVNSLDYDR